MPRSKEFDREVALEAAKAVFWRQGYEATSTEDLRHAMGIGRQSFYDSFQGKRELFVEVLERYNAEGVRGCVARVEAAPSALAGIEALLLSFSREKAEQRLLGCMGVTAVCELGVSDADVSRVGAASAARLEGLLEQQLKRAKAAGEVRDSVDERKQARLLYAAIIGMKVMSKAGASAEALRDVANAALDGLRARPSGARRPKAGRSASD
ncbi:TetR/AcrR family transcriptional regulator [Sorangium sp. So ce1389]|uniref:TetR/AcrR family transcriptional regulator n=1 Tax=Sorangium sp. So ce1389 TaxID=3133336 RepID=UPI003F60B131